MSFLERDTIGGSKQFYFDGFKMIDALVTTYKNDPGEEINVTMVYSGLSAQLDHRNILAFQEQLNALFMQNWLKREFTRNNKDEDHDIHNIAQSQQFEEVRKMNNALAIFFMYFLHRFNWFVWENIESDDDGNTTKDWYNTNQQPIGQSMNTIIEEIKTIYPIVFNLFAKLIEKKYPGQSRIAIMNVQDMNERVTEITNLGTNPVVKAKKVYKVKTFANK